MHAKTLAYDVNTGGFRQSIPALLKPFDPFYGVYESLHLDFAKFRSERQQIAFTNLLDLCLYVAWRQVHGVVHQLCAHQLDYIVTQDVPSCPPQLDQGRIGGRKHVEQWPHLRCQLKRDWRLHGGHALTPDKVENFHQTRGGWREHVEKRHGFVRVTLVQQR